jgi:hypothetical protein
LLNAFPALLAAAGEREALRVWMRMVCRRKESEPDIGMDQEIARAMEAAHDPEGFKAQCEQRLAVANERCVAANREVNALRAQTAALQAEVDACGAIIGQPPGAKGGHAEIIDATIKEHQAANAKLRAEVERLQAALGGLLDRLRPQDFRGDPRFADAALDCARAVLDEILMEGSIKWDGCINLDIGGRGESYRNHFCSLHGALIVERAMRAIYALAAQNVARFDAECAK